MTTNEKQYYIYIRSLKERVPVTKEEFDNYYRDINAYRQKEQYHKRCVCPKAKFLDCDMDCATCPYHRPGDHLVLDYVSVDEDGNESCWSDNLEDPSPLLEDAVTDGIQLNQLLNRINELMPQAVQIGQVRQLGYTEEAIAAEIGVGRKTYAYRLKKLKAAQESEFPEFF